MLDVDRDRTGSEMTKEILVDTSWKVEIDRTTPAEWAEMLDLFNDANFYQTWSYGSVRWGRENLSHLILKRDDDVLGMAQVRIVRPTSLKFGMAYLRWGPLCERRGLPPNPEVATRVAQALEKEYVEKRKLFVRVIPNAFIGSARAQVLQSAFSRFTSEPLVPDNTYRTFVLDLTLPLEELRKNLDRKWRNQLTRAEKNNLTVIAGNGVGEYRAFCDIYRQMRQRKTFETTVDEEEFLRIQEELPESQRMRILLCQENGVTVAGMVATAMGDSAIYLLGATSDNGLNAKGAYLLQWNMIQWLKENGTRWYDLGGIDPEANPGVYHFKKGFSGSDMIQTNPLVASNSAVSSVIAKAGLAVQRAFRSSSGPVQLARNLKHLATKH
jgi:lipid II:glycine glycyltransferase (peptidoglycan interpeptide bridge formation enzyme)